MSQKDQEADENKSLPLEDDVETPKETAGFESEICRFTLRDCHQSIHFTLVPLQLYVTISDPIQDIQCWQTWGWSQMMMIIKLPSTIIYVFVVGHDTWDPKPPKNTGTSSCPKVHICAFAQYAQEASSGAAAALEDSKYKGDLNVRLGTSCSQGCANNLNLMRNTIVQVAACGFSLPPTLRWWCGLPGKLSRLSYQKGLQVGRVESA